MGWSTRVRNPSKGKTALYLTASRPALGPHKLRTKWKPGILSQWMKWPEREADHSIPSSAEVDNGDTIISLPHTPSWLGAQLLKYSGNLTFSAYFPMSVCSDLIFSFSMRSMSYQR
jgi:hypothetical protein